MSTCNVACILASIEVLAFQMEYGNWVEEQSRQMNELRLAFQTHAPDVELKILVESGMRHYDDLFRIKAIATKADVFYIMSGMWRTATERFFLWIGGFRPSELLKVRHLLYNQMLFLQLYHKYECLVMDRS